MRHPIISCFSLLVMLVAGGCAADSGQNGNPPIRSGLAKGDDIIPWNPIHVAGPNAGTNACPVCTYEARPAVVIFTHQSADLPLLCNRLESLVRREKAHDLKGFIVVLDATPEQMKHFAADHPFTPIGICYPDPQTREKDLADYKINPAAESTAIVYKDYKVKADLVNVTSKDFNRVESAVGGVW